MLFIHSVSYEFEVGSKAICAWFALVLLCYAHKTNCLHASSCTGRNRLHAFASSSDCFIVLLTFVAIRQRK